MRERERERERERQTERDRGQRMKKYITTCKLINTWIPPA